MKYGYLVLVYSSRYYLLVILLKLNRQRIQAYTTRQVISDERDTHAAHDTRRKERTRKTNE